MRDMQSEIIAELMLKLGAVPDFGQSVFEDSVVAVLDADDSELAEDFIVIQQGACEEVERVGPSNVRERVTLNLVAITKRRESGAALRAGRLAIKSALRGLKGGLTTQGVQSLTFTNEESFPRQPGRRLSARNLQIQITYIQAYN